MGRFGDGSVNDRAVGTEQHKDDYSLILSSSVSGWGEAEILYPA